MTFATLRTIVRHVEYWTELAKNGVALISGPVLDPAGSHGIGVVAVESEKDLKELTANHPVSKSGQQFN
jgi:uncharacterized protein